MMLLMNDDEVIPVYLMKNYDFVDSWKIDKEVCKPYSNYGMF